MIRTFEVVLHLCKGGNTQGTDEKKLTYRNLQGLLYMFTHCNIKFKPHETWFLYNNKNFTRRKFYLATCPICQKGLAKLVETRIDDGEVFSEVVSGSKLEKLMPRLIKEVRYTNEDMKKFKTSPFGLCYGNNKEIHNSKGEIIEIRQTRCDFYGNKELILSVKISQ